MVAKRVYLKNGIEQIVGKRCHRPVACLPAGDLEIRRIIERRKKIVESLDMGILNNGAQIIVNETIRQRIKVNQRSDADKQKDGQ